jgi:hypothetical protein
MRFLPSFVCWPIVAMFSVLPLSGCFGVPFGDSPVIFRAHVTTVPPLCTVPAKTPPATGSDVEVLRAAFTRVRTATPLAIAEPKQVTFELATDRTIGVPLVHVQAEKLVTPDTLSGTLENTARRLQAARALVATRTTAAAQSTPESAAESPVEQELARRIPWLADDSTAVVAKQAAEPGASQAADAGLQLISLIVEKKAALTTVASHNPPTTFDTDDQKRIHASLQQFAGFEPFHLITLVVAQQIINYLGQESDPHRETPTLIALVAIFNASDFLATYFDEYLRGGQFLQISANQQSLENDTVAQFSGRLKIPLTGDAQAQLRKAMDQICANAAGSCTPSTSFGSDSYTSIFGQTVQFAGVTVAFNGSTPKAPWRPTITAPSASAFAPQMVQVLVEALFDANGPHPPALSTSTACAKQLFQDVDEPGIAQCVDLSATDSQWQSMNAIGNATQALVTTGVGTVIRGGGSVALNNETIASTVETLAGVATRKAVQQVMWVCKAPASTSVDTQNAAR